MLKPGDRFRHFKSSGTYRIVSLFTWETTNEAAVLYENELTGERWGRTLKVFLETVASPQDPDKQIPRFERETSQPADADFRLYRLEQKSDEKGLLYFEVYNAMGVVVATLKDGIAPLIAMTFVNMSGQSPQRGDDYMAGVVNGCTHLLLLPNSSTSGTVSQPDKPESTKPSQSNSPPKSNK